MKPKTILTSFVITSLVILIVGCSSASTCTDVPINILVTLTDGTKYDIYLTKPVRQDPTGIWAVEKYCKK